jgi:membrane protein
MVVQQQTLAPQRGGIVVRVWQRIQHDDCFDLAAQIAFYFSLSLLPFCLVLAVIVGWLPSTSLWRAFVTWVVTYLPSQSQHLIFSTILELVNDSTGFLSLGLLTALWSASSGFLSLMESLSVVYLGRDRRPYWRKRAIATCVALIAMVFALGCFGLMAFGHWGVHLSSTELGRWNLSHSIWVCLRWAVTLAIMGLAVDLANCFLPDGHRAWRWITPGSAFAVLTLVGMSAVFNLYISHFTSYPKIYGTLGGFIILMLWIYIASLILLVGAETDREFEENSYPARVG